jgi:hypothetical protein
VIPYDPSEYENLTIDEVDAQFASMPSSRSKVLPSNNASKLPAATPSTIPMITCRPSYPQNTLSAAINSIDSYTNSDADVPPEEDAAR